MSFNLSARQMADHAAAYEQIKRRPITSEEMLHIAKLHHEGDAQAGAVSLNRDDIRMGRTAREGGTSLAEGDIRMGRSAQAGSTSLAQNDIRMGGPQVSVGAPTIHGAQVAVGMPSIDGAQPSQSAPLDFSGESPALTGQADPGGAPIDFGGDPPGSALAMGTPGEPLDFQGDASQMAGAPATGAPMDFAGDTSGGAVAGAPSEGVSPVMAGDSATMSPAEMYSSAEGMADGGMQEPAYQPPGSIKDLAYKDDAYGDFLARRADQRDQEATGLGNQAQAESDDAALNLTQATIEANKATSAEYDKLNQEAANTEQRLNEIIAQGEQTAAKQMERVQLASASAASTEMKDFFADKSTFGKIMAVISQSLAGGANYLAGQPGAPTPLDKFIADDVHRQTVNLGLKKDNAERQKDLLEQAYKATGSRIAAQAAVTDAAYAKADAAMKAASARMNTPQAIAAYQKAHAATLQKRAELAQKSADALRDDAIKSSGGAGKLLADLQKNADKRNALADKQKAQDAFQLEDVETPPGTPNSFKERLAKKVLEPAKEVLTAVDDLQTILRNAKPNTFDRWAKTTQGQAALKVLEKNRANFGGNLSANESVLLEALSGGENLQKYAQFFNSPAYAEALARLSVRVKKSVAASMSYQGMRIRPGSVFYLKQATASGGAPAGTAAAPRARVLDFSSTAPDTDSDSDGDSTGDSDGDGDA